jgi:catechol-2,3-dioxygenase
VHVQALGRAVLKVRNLQRSEDFFSGMLGMPIISRISDPGMIFFALETSGNHHDFALMEVGFDALSPGDDTMGLLTWHSRSAVQPRSLVLNAACSMARGPGSSMRRSGALQEACTCSIRTGTRSSYT